jgi:hypothetical protein
MEKRSPDYSDYNNQPDYYGGATANYDYYGDYEGIGRSLSGSQ